MVVRAAKHGAAGAERWTVRASASAAQGAEPAGGVSTNTIALMLFTGGGETTATTLSHAAHSYVLTIEPRIRG
jgi:hypothetical protein